MESSGPPVHFLNLEYFFRLIYDLLFGVATPSGSADGGIGGGASGTAGTVAGGGLSGLVELANSIWTVVTVGAYLFTLAAIGVLVYYTMRLYQIREEEEEKYSTISKEASHEHIETSRWVYIQELMRRGHESDWRQAIIEADVILDELLVRLGYPGDSLGERLRAVNPSQFQTLQNAWEAHKVRNEIAHQGSAFQLTEQVAYRTIANYEAVFREHEEL